MSEHVKAKELKKLRGHQKLMRRRGGEGRREGVTRPACHSWLTEESLPQVQQEQISASHPHCTVHGLLSQP